MSIRITQNQVVANMQALFNSNYANLTNLEEQVATGKRILKPSDDPQNVGADLETRSSLAELKQYNANIQDGLGLMGATDTALGSVNTLLQRMRELAVEGSSDTLTSSERPFLNAEVQQLTTQLISIVNTQYKGGYIFSGTQTKTSPVELKTSSCTDAADYANLSMASYNAAGQTAPATVQLKNSFDGSAINNIIPGTFSLKVGGTTYNENTDYTVDYAKGTITITNPALLVDTSPGTANYASGQFGISFSYCAKEQNIYGSTISSGGEIQRDIDTGISEPINISADQILNDPTNGSNMLTTAITLGQDLLQNNTAGIASAISGIDAVSQSVSAANAQNGARVNLFQNALTKNEQETTSATSTLSTLEDADIATTATNYTNAQNVYNASLQAGATMIQQSLANFLSG